MFVLCQLLYVEAVQLRLPSGPLSCTTLVSLYAKSAVFVSAALALPFPQSTASVLAVLLLEVQLLIRYAYSVVLGLLTRDDRVVSTRGQASLLLVIVRTNYCMFGHLARICVGVDPFPLVI